MTGDKLYLSGYVDFVPFMQQYQYDADFNKWLMMKLASAVQMNQEECEQLSMNMRQIITDMASAMADEEQQAASYRMTLYLAKGDG